MNQIEKWMTSFMMGTTSSITMQSLGKIVLRAPAVSANMWCFFVFVCLSRSESGAPCVRGVHSSNKHCVAVYRPISKKFSSFSEGSALSEALHSSHFAWQMAPQIPRNGGQKLRKFKKPAEKFVRNTSYRQLSDLKKSTAVVQGRVCRCAPPI